MADKSDYLEFTGERIIPELENYFFYEHLARYRFVKQFIDSEDELLDVGCGDGYGTYYLANFVKRATGVDVDEKTIGLARKKYERENLYYKRIDAAQDIILEDKFNIVTCFEVFEHVENTDLLLQQINNSLKDYGKCIISTPNIDVYGENFKIPFHVKEYTLDEFQNCLSRHFSIEHVYGQFHKSIWLKKWNFFLSKSAMKYQLLLKLANWSISQRTKKYLEHGYFDSLDLSDNYFSMIKSCEADYFVIVCSKKVESLSL